jgi:hypothetical protein
MSATLMFPAFDERAQIAPAVAVAREFTMLSLPESVRLDSHDCLLLLL